MRRGDIYWAAFPQPIGRRPALVISRTSALAYLKRVTVAPITTTIRGRPSELLLGTAHNLPYESVAGCDSLMTIEKSALEDRRIGRLSPREHRSLDDALRFALGIGP